MGCNVLLGQLVSDRQYRLSIALIAWRRSRGDSPLRFIDSPHQVDGGGPDRAQEVGGARHCRGDVACRTDGGNRKTVGGGTPNGRRTAYRHIADSPGDLVNRGAIDV